MNFAREAFLMLAITTLIILSIISMKSLKTDWINISSQRKSALISYLVLVLILLVIIADVMIERLTFKQSFLVILGTFVMVTGINSDAYLMNSFTGKQNRIKGSITSDGPKKDDEDGGKPVDGK